MLQWLASAGAAAALAGSLAGCRVEDERPGIPKPPPGPRYRGARPNILLVLVDDLAAEVMGQGSRFPFLACPNVSRLQREGATFTQAFVPTSVCSPSRASLLTGAYAHQHGVVVNDVRDLDDTLPNFPALLGASGYDTGFVGKWHMDSASSAPRLGFDYWLSFAGQGVYKDPYLNENGREFRRHGYLTDILTEYAVDFIQAPRKKPFCLIVSHKAGHVPFEAAPRHKNAFRGATLPEPPNFAETFSGKPAWQRRYKLCGLARQEWEACEGVELPEELPLEPWNARDGALLEHLRTLLAVDEGLGVLLEALDSVEQLDNTVVIFTSDNGFLLGAHRLYDKRTMYEESLRVPLVVRDPKRVRAGSRFAQLVSTLDLAPTVLEAAGVAPPESMQGASLAPLFKGTGAPWREVFLYEYFQEVPGPGVPTILGVRTERWKYVHYPDLPDDLDELYDLHTDPHELRNLIEMPEYALKVAELQGLLQQQLAESGYRPP
jgi:N-acetylglucosamine-6-sulfatase